MISSTSITVLASCLSAVYAHAIREAAPLITPAPLMPRQAPQAFVGYYSTSGVSSWAVEQCLSGGTPHGTFMTSGSYGACCASSCSSTAFATTCSGIYAMYPDGPLSCSYTCNTDFVLSTANDANPTLWIGCDSDGKQTNFYRNTPAAATTSSTPSTPSTTVTVPPVTSSPVPTPTPTPQKKSSKAWIAGVVVGPLVLLAIVGALIFVFCFKKKNTSNQAPQAYQAAPQMAVVGQQPQQPYMQPPPGAEQRYSTPAPQYSNQPYQQTQSPPPGQQWAQTPSPGPTVTSPMSTGTYASDKPLSTQNLAQQEQQYLDTKTPKSPVPTVSEIASPQTYGPPSGISEVPSSQTYPAQPATQSNYGTQAGPVPSHLPPNHASELQ